MNDAQQDKMLDVAKHLVTLAMASLGFVVTMMFASSGDEPLVRVTEYRLSLQSALTLFLCSVVFGFLTEAAIVGVSLGQQQRLFFGRWF